MNNKIRDESLDYHALIAMPILLSEQGDIQFSADKEAARQFFSTTR